MKRKQVIALLTTGMLILQTPINSMAAKTVNGTSYSGTEYETAVTGDITSGVMVDGGDQLTVNGDVSGDAHFSAVEATGTGSSLTVNGNISGDTSDTTSGVVACDGGSVNVKGNVTGKNTGVVGNLEGSVIKVEGNVHGGITGVHVNEGASAEIKGNVKGENENGVATEGDNSTITVVGDVEGYVTGVNAKDNATVTVVGNVKSTMTGVNADNNATVTVNGNIEGDSGVVANNKANATVTGNVKTYNTGVLATTGANITVTGNIESDNEAVVAYGNSNVTVKGDASGRLVGVSTSDGSTAVIDGNVSGEAGLKIMDSGKAVISGDVEGKTSTAVFVLGKNSFVLVEGNATGCDDKGVEVNTKYNTWDTVSTVEVLGTVNGKIIVDVKSDDTVGQALNKMGNVIAGEIKTDGTLVQVKGNDSISNELAGKIAEQKVYYIVNTEKVANGTITITQTSDMLEVLNADGTTKLDAYGNKLLAANQNKEITVKIVPDSGYRVKSADAGQAKLVLQKDGTYLLTVPEGGGIDISALIEKIAENEKKKSGSTKKQSEKTTSSASKTETAAAAVTQVSTDDVEEVISVPVLNVQTEATGLLEMIADRYYGDIITAVYKTEKPVADEVAVPYTVGIAEEDLVIIDEEAITEDIEELKLNIDRSLVKEMEAEGLKEIQFMIESHKIAVETEKLALLMDQYGCKKIVIHVIKNEDGTLDSEVTVDITSILELDMTEE